MITILAGCAATVVLELFRRFLLKREFPNRWYAWILVAFLVFALFQAWEEQYTSAEGRAALISDVAVQNASLERDKNGQAAQIQLLQNQVHTQQETLNEAVVQLGKANAPVPLKITALPLREIDAHSAEFILLTNQQITPVRLLVTCPAGLREASAGVLGAGLQSVGGWGGRFSGAQFGVGILSPAWTPISPLLVTLRYDQEKLGTCYWNQQGL